MPYLFSYGTLREESVQLSMFGRLLDGQPDALVGFEQHVMTITDPDFVATSGKADHAIVDYTGRPEDRVEGKVLEVSEDELSRCDEYEPEGYERTTTTLASGKTAWVYVRVGS